MKLVDFFDNPIFNFPGESHVDFQLLVKQDFGVFLSLLKEIDDEHKEAVEEIYQYVDQLCTSLLKILDHVYAGKLIDAYNVLKGMMDQLEKDLTFNKFPDDDYHFYRARTIIEQPITTADEMFHVPFEERHKLKTNRYSVPGLPCLYLSNSVLTCWAELNQPPLEKIVVSRFRTSDRLNYLNLIPDYQWFRDSLYRIQRSPEQRSAQASHYTVKSWLPRTIKVFPLLYLCYRKVQHQEAAFKPEYIFPQLLMQWLLKKKEYHGIRYMSTKCEPSGDHNNVFINYAIPVRSVKATKYCDSLSRQFTVTAPLQLDTINSSKEIKSDFTHDINLDFTSLITTYRKNGETHNYIDSKFKKFELQVAKLPPNRIINSYTNTNIDLIKRREV